MGLRRLHRLAGRPSLVALGRTMACSHSTVSAYLNGRRLPDPHQLESFVLACNGNAPDWLQRLEAVRQQLDGLPATEISRLTPDELRDEAATERAEVISGHSDSAVGSEAEETVHPAPPYLSTTGQEVTAARVTGSLTREPRSGSRALNPAELLIFGTELTKMLRMRGRTLEQAATSLAIPPREVARWASGQALPSESNARSLDEYLTARGAIQNLVAELRSRPGRSDSWGWG